MTSTPSPDFVSVPREATEEMLRAGQSAKYQAGDNNSYEAIKRIWRALLSTAPAPKVSDHIGDVTEMIKCLPWNGIGAGFGRNAPCLSCFGTGKISVSKYSLRTDTAPPLVVEDGPSRIVELFGDRYDGPREDLSGGDLNDLHVAHQIALLGRKDICFEGVLDTAKDRIRWLSRQLEIAKASTPSPREMALEEALKAIVQSGKMSAKARDDQRFGDVTIAASAYDDAKRALSLSPSAPAQALTIDDAQITKIAFDIAREDWNHGWWPTEDEIARGDENDQAWIRRTIIPNNEAQLAEDAEKLVPVIRRALQAFTNARGK